MRPKRDGIPIEVSKVIGTGLMVMGLCWVLARLPELYSDLTALTSPTPVQFTKGRQLADALTVLNGLSMFAGGLVVLRRPARLVVVLYLVTLLTLVAAIASARYLVIAMKLSFSTMNIRSGAPILGALGLPAVGVATIILLRRIRARNAGAESAPSCQQCGYAMRGLAEPRCPECGRVYTLDEFHAL